MVKENLKSKNETIKGKNLTRKFNIALLATSVLVLLFSFGVFFYFLNLNENIQPNVYVNGIDLSNLSKIQAKNTLSKHFVTPKLNLEFNGKSEEDILRKIDFAYDYDKAVDQAYGIGRDGNPFENIADLVKLNLGEGKVVPLESSYDGAKLVLLCDEIEKKVSRPSKNASIDIKKGKINVISGKSGVVLKKAQLLEQIKGYIASQDMMDTTMTLPFEEVPPDVTQKDLRMINGRIGSYTTKYADGATGRPHNIRLTAEKLKGEVIMPGQEVSFLESIGDISSKTGFQNDIIILNDEFVTGMGGGVCQVSSTLYNALVNSGVTITERTKHSLPVHYVPEGMDATVATGGPDLKYKNNHSYPVYIDSYTDKGRLTIDIYGKI